MVKQYLVSLLSLMLTVYLNGCMVSSTSCQGNLSITSSASEQANTNVPNKEAERYIVVSLWDYPTVNGKKGDIVINTVVLTEEKSITIDFPSKFYTVVWTPVFGTQHLAPEPGVVIFNKNYFPSWNVGGTDHHARMCCEKPRSKHNFQIDMIGSEQALLHKKVNSPFDKCFLEEFLAKEKDLINKMKKCKGLSGDEINMVLDKLSQTAGILGISTD